MSRAQSLRRWGLRGSLIGLAVSLTLMAAAAIMAWRSGSAEYIGAGWMILFGFTLPWSLISQWLRDYSVWGAWASVVIIAPMLQAAFVATILWTVVAITRRLTRR